MESLSIVPVGPLHGEVRPPGSKSLTNRALVCAALAKGQSTLRGALDSEDTRVMIDSLTKLGIDVTANSNRTTLRVAGCGGKIPAREADLWVANSGTTIRFLTALVSLGDGSYRLDGIERMRQRPIGDLIEALNQLGCDARHEGNNACPPVNIHAHGLTGGKVTMRGDISSQYLSGMLMVSPLAQKEVTIHLEGELISRPYVQMTLEVMQAFGCPTTKQTAEQPQATATQFVIPGGRCYQATDYAIEPDASAASYFWGAAAITGGQITVAGLNRQALQGDVAFVDCLQKMGCQIDVQQEGITVTGGQLRGVEVDMADISDTAQTLSTVALFAEGPTRIRGIGHNRHKETDRIGDLARELRKVGASVEEHSDGMTIIPGPLQGVSLATYNDHRMAMSLALIGLRQPGIEIENPRCVEKTYPRYFEDLQALCQSCD